MYRCTTCEPFRKEIIDLGEMNREQVIHTFHQFPWSKHLQEMSAAPETQEVFFSPSVNVVHSDQQHELSLSILGEENDVEFLIMFVRPKMKSSLFGLKKTMEQRYMSEKTGYTQEQAFALVESFLDGNWEALELEMP